jgi:PHD/YefM family antitoxin component YafN of YafNO toxin-antitoxin module
MVTPKREQSMFRSDDIQPVTDFVRNHKRYLAHLRATGRPGLLTINGTPELVVQDVRSYEEVADEVQRLRAENRALKERLEDLETRVALDEAFAELERGEGVPVEEAVPELRRRLGIGVPVR